MDTGTRPHEKKMRKQAKASILHRIRDDLALARQQPVLGDRATLEHLAQQLLADQSDIRVMRTSEAERLELAKTRGNISQRFCKSLRVGRTQTLTEYAHANPSLDAFMIAVCQDLPDKVLLDCLLGSRQKGKQVSE